MYEMPMVELTKHELKEALFWRPLAQNAVQCRLCNRFCTVKPNEQGFCGVRKNISGKLCSLVYGRALGIAVDPIEKKPLFHFKPGTRCASFGTFGCNFRCPYCQNWQMSQVFDESMIESVPYTSPGEIVSRTRAGLLPGISYTYNEPTVFAEYALDTMKLAREKGLYNVWVSNGYMTTEALDEITPYLDAANIDLKGDDALYEKLCYKVKRKKVMDNIAYMHKKGVHVEATMLIIPGWNDSDACIKEIAGFVASVSPDIPLHFSRFFPQFKMLETPITPEQTVNHAAEIARKAGLNYVYKGNLAGIEETRCKKCNALLVSRDVYNTTIKGLKGSKCAKCGSENNFVV